MGEYTYDDIIREAFQTYTDAQKHPDTDGLARQVDALHVALDAMRERDAEHPQPSNVSGTARPADDDPR